MKARHVRNQVSKQIRRRNGRRLSLEPLERRSLLTLVNWWTADNTAADAVGTNHGTLVSGASYASGQVGQAFSLDGVDDRVQVADSESLKLTGSLTIEGWIKVDSLPTVDHGEILFRGDDRGGLDPYALSVEPNGTVRFLVTPATNQGVSVASPAPIGEFFHVAATLDDTTGSMRLYLNGALTSQLVTAVRPFADLDPASNPGIGIGNHGGHPDTPHNFPLDGLIDELKVYDEALTAEQVLANYNATKSEELPSLAIEDVTVTEGAPAFGDAGYLVPPNGSGLATARNVQLGPDGNLYVASHDTDSIKIFVPGSGQYLGELTTADGTMDAPWGLVFGPDGKLYVGGRYSRNVVRFDISTGNHDVFVPGASGGVGAVRGLTFGPNGDLFVSSRVETQPTTSDTIKRYDGATGAYLGDFVTAGSGGLDNANGLAFGPDGDLHVASTKNSQILRYDGVSGTFLNAFIPAGTGGLINPTQFVFHSDGLLYVTGNGNSVLRFNPYTGAFADVVVSGLPFSGNGLTFGPAGDLYVSIGSPTLVSGSAVARYLPGFTAISVGLSAPSQSTVSVDYVAVNGTAVAGSDYQPASGTLTFAPGVTTRSVLVKVLDDAAVEPNETFGIQLSNPSNATIADGNGVVTIVDHEAMRQLSISDTTATEGSTAAHYRGAFVNDGATDGGHFNPLTFGPDGHLYTSVGTGASTNSIRKYDGVTGDFLGTVVPKGRINGVRDILFRNGLMYVASAYTNEVLRFNATTGAFVDAFVAAGSGGIQHPDGMEFGPDANSDGVPELYVTGGLSHSVVRYDGVTGQPLGTLIAAGSGGLQSPFGLTFGPGGLYVTSVGTNQILKFSSQTGAFLGVAASSGIDYPRDVVFGPDGLMYVTNADDDRILRFTSAGAYVDDYVPAGSGGMDRPRSLAFGAGGDLYVTATGNDEILRFGTQSEAVFHVSLAASNSLPISVNYSTANGTATAGSDYATTSGTLTFQPGVTKQTIRVPLLNDGVYEGTESFVVNLSNPSAGASILDSQGVATIFDNDPMPTKFYVVDDAAANKTFEYNAAGALVESYNVNSGNTAPRGAASTIAGDKVWVVDANKKVYVYNASGGLLGSWTAGTLASNATPEGIATDGTDVWIVDSQGDKVFKYAGAATRLSGSQNAASSFSLNASNTGPKDLVTNGAHLWLVNDSSTDKVFKYTVAGSLVGSWTVNGGGGSPTGITVNPANVSDIWIVDSGTDKVYQYTAAAGRTSGSQNASAIFDLAGGNTNPQGIADPPAGVIGNRASGMAEQPVGRLVAIDAAIAEINLPRLGNGALRLGGAATAVTSSGATPRNRLEVYARVDGDAAPQTVSAGRVVERVRVLDQCLEEWELFA